MPKIAIMPSPRNWLGEPPTAATGAAHRLEEMIEEEHDVVRQALFDDGARLANVDEHDRDEPLGIGRACGSPAPVIGGDIGRQQRQNRDVARRAKLAGEPHVARGAKPRQHGRLVRRGLRQAVEAAQNRMRQVEQRPRPPQIEACGIAARRLASSTASPRGMRTAWPLG